MVSQALLGLLIAALGGVMCWGMAKEGYPYSWETIFYMGKEFSDLGISNKYVDKFWKYCLLIGMVVVFVVMRLCWWVSLGVLAWGVMKYFFWVSVARHKLKGIILRKMFNWRDTTFIGELFRGAKDDFKNKNFFSALILFPTLILGMVVIFLFNAYGLAIYAYYIAMFIYHFFFGG